MYISPLLLHVIYDTVYLATADQHVFVFLYSYRFVSMLPKGTIFVVFCFLLRIVMAFGGAAADTASFAIVAGEFGSSLGIVMVIIIVKAK